MYIADSIDNGVKSLRKNIEFRYQNSEFLQKMIPNKAVRYADENGDDVDVSAGRKFTDVRIEFANVRGDHFVLRLFGAKSGVRGAKELGVRPQLAIIDDIISDEDARSETIISSIEDVIHKAVKYALHPKKHKVIWLGTPFNANDPLYKAVESGSYEVACFPVCEKFPCSKEEFRGSWEDRFDYDYVQRSYNEAVSLGKADTFYQELMLQIMSDENRIVRDEDIVWYDRNEVLKYKRNYNYYITTDFATSEKSSSDYSVISVWAINNNGDYLLVDGVCKKQLMDKNINDLFVLASVYKPLGVGIEVSGQQRGFVSWVQSEMIKRNVFFNLVSSNNDGNAGIRPVADKFARFNLFLPRIKAKKLWLPNELKGGEWMNEALDELSKASSSGFKSKHDDVLDTISMLASFEVYKPSSNYTIGKEYRKENLPPMDEENKNPYIF
jgi:predicted phage terminase large subunit-like protein